jgi:hypothetical protein
MSPLLLYVLVACSVIALRYVCHYTLYGTKVAVGDWVFVASYFRGKIHCLRIDLFADVTALGSAEYFIQVVYRSLLPAILYTLRSPRYRFLLLFSAARTHCR